MRAALYARFSTDKQSSTADQLRVCRTIAERHGFEVVVEYSDEAISGGTANRPGYQQLLAAARQALQERRREVERRTRQPTVAEMVFDAERAYREDAMAMREVLQGDDVATGREVLREMFGEIALEPDTGAERPVLWAILDPRPVALEASAGGGVNRSGSGGRIWSRLRVPLPARRFSAQPPRR